MSEEERTHQEIIASTKEKLRAQGFDGLYYDGTCACDLDDLAPCGSYEIDPHHEDFINGCQGGYKHFDPRPEHAGDWCISKKKEPPSDEDWERVNYE